MLRKRKAVVGRERMVPSNVRRGGVFMLECISFNLLEAEDILYLFSYDRFPEFSALAAGCP